jgi:hypothetical protein
MRLFRLRDACTDPESESCKNRNLQSDNQAGIETFREAAPIIRRPLVFTRRTGVEVGGASAVTSHSAKMSNGWYGDASVTVPQV